MFAFTWIVTEREREREREGGREGGRESVCMFVQRPVGGVEQQRDEARIRVQCSVFRLSGFGFRGRDL